MFAIRSTVFSSPTYRALARLSTAAGLVLACTAAARAENYSCDSAYINGKIVVAPTFGPPKSDGSTGTVNLCDGGIYAWNAFIALNWPSAAGNRGQPDLQKPFGGPGTPVWETYRNKVELYPGNGNATTPPHGVKLPVKPSDYPYGYGDAPAYVYAPSQTRTTDGSVPPCEGQTVPATPAFVNLDETTQIGNNMLFAGVIESAGGSGNSAPQLVRYDVKMNEDIYGKIIEGTYWYKSPQLTTAEANYIKQLSNQGQDPSGPYVNLGPSVTEQKKISIELKTSWRQLTEAEVKSGRFYTTTARFYETGKGKPFCYRESRWGLLGMHLISFTSNAPWVIWATFEQADNILTADGKPTEDVNGKSQIPPIDPTSPKLTSNPAVPNPVVKATGVACTLPASRLYFRENPQEKALPANINICVNARWHAIPDYVQALNQAAHDAMDQKAKTPWAYYKLINVQPVPVNGPPSASTAPRFTDLPSYYLANATIETDYSLGNFTGHMVAGAPSNVTSKGEAYFNTKLLPFQALRFFTQPIAMGGCAGCHGNAAQRGSDFSFALLGNTVSAPELPNAFETKLFRSYFK